MQPEFLMCIDLYGKCRCAIADRPPCDAMIDMVENGQSADDERERMDCERSDAELDGV